MKPGEFLIGVIDLFGIIAPGAVFLFLQRRVLENVLLGQSFDPDKTWMLAVFLLGAYVLGHFLLGLSVPLNRLLKLFFSKDHDALYLDVKDKIKLPPEPPGKDGFLRSLWKKSADERAPAFYRAYAFVRLKNASALAEVERQMADYKLFRSLMLVFAIDFVLCIFEHPPFPARTFFSATLCILAAWRFLFLLNWTYQITFEYYALLQGDSSSGAKDALLE